MWESYERNFIRFQLAIALATYVAFTRTHLHFVAAAFFVAMQGGAVLGAILGDRLKRKRALIAVPAEKPRWSRA
jgi:hypothetical protein